jgi:uncharacterized membrane protein YfcA
VPVLIALFGESDLVAKGTSLLIMLPASVTATWVGLRNGLLDWRRGLAVGAAAAVASLGGVACAFLIPPDVGGYLFAGLIAVAGLQIALRQVRSKR